jgi:peptide methionine sulfoxide reductase MsrB
METMQESLGSGMPMAKKILIVEDNKDLADLLSMHLRDLAFDVEAFDNEYWNNKKDGIYVYCMNSAALRFIPKEDLEKEGYGEYLKHFTK